MSPRVDAEATCESEPTLQHYKLQHQETFVVNSGDFNYVTLDSTPAVPGKSDHNAAYMQPMNTPVVRKQPVTPRL